MAFRGLGLKGLGFRVEGLGTRACVLEFGFRFKGVGFRHPGSSKVQPLYGAYIGVM